MIGSTVALAAAASFPAPFVSGGSADVGIVYGSSGASSDLVAAADIQSSLSSALASQGGSSSSGTPTGGDFVQLDKSSNHLNFGDALNGPFGSSVDDGDLPNTLADGVYTADDSDDFDYEQRITLGNSTLQFFRDSDYEDQQGFSERTPTVGVRIADGTFILNYTLNFLDQAESDVLSDGSLDDITGSDLPLLGKMFYVSTAKNGTTAGTAGKFTLLDSADSAIVSEGETVTLNSGGTNYDVSIQFVDADKTILVVNGEVTNSMKEGETFKLQDGSYVAIRELLTQDYQGGIKTVDFSIGNGKLEMNAGQDIQINDESISDVKAWVYTAGNTATTKKLDKIVIQWVANDDLFITPDSEIVLPGFGGIKLSMNDLVRPTEEKVVVQNDADTSIEIRAPVESGDAVFNLLYANSTGDFVGLGKASDERLATTSSSELIYKDKLAGSEYDEYVVVTFNDTDSAESYLLSFSTNEDTSAGRNETTVKNEVTKQTETSDLAAGDTFKLGDIQFTINEVIDNSTDNWVNITADTNVNFNYLYTKGGLGIALPTEGTNVSTAAGNINLTDASAVTGHNIDSFYLFMDDEDKDDTLNAGTGLTLTIDDTSSDHNLQVKSVNTTGYGAGSGTGGPAGLEVGDSSNTYEAYVLDDVAPRIMHYTDPDEDWAEVYYPTGDSETYAQVFLSDANTNTGSSTTDLGSINVLDSEVSSVSSNNLIVVGGSCVNTVAATLLKSSSPVCGGAFQTKTGIGAGSFLIQTFNSPFSSGKIATLVAGYNAGDTTNAATYFTTQDVDTSVGNKYVGDSITSASLVTA